MRIFQDVIDSIVGQRIHHSHSSGVKLAKPTDFFSSLARSLSRHPEGNAHLHPSARRLCLQIEIDVRSPSASVLSCPEAAMQQRNGSLNGNHPTSELLVGRRDGWTLRGLSFILPQSVDVIRLLGSRGCDHHQSTSCPKQRSFGTGLELRRSAA